MDRRNRTPVRVGIVGLSATAGWASIAHLPALRALPGYELRGLSASSPVAAAAAGDKHQVPRVFATAKDLIEDDEIELVVVAVKVTDHRELLEQAIAVGKPVVSEWPLAVNLSEAEQVTAAADRAGVKTLAGLQARSAPAVRRIAGLIRQGVIGEVLSTSVRGGGGNWAGRFASRGAYQLDRANGATLITIPLAHTLDALTAVLGPFTELTATTATRRRTAVNPETGDSAPVTAEDEVALSGLLAGGVVASVHLHGGIPARDGFVWRIHGSQGDLTITQDWAHPQFGPLTIDGPGDVAIASSSSATDPPDLAERLPGGENDPAYNVAHAYLGFHTWLTGGPRSTPTFADAVIHHRLLEAVHQAATTGTRQHLDPPTC
jgi:predicted dehydrogenase